MSVVTCSGTLFALCGRLAFSSFFLWVANRGFGFPSRVFAGVSPSCDPVPTSPIRPSALFLFALLLGVRFSSVGIGDVGLLADQFLDGSQFAFLIGKAERNGHSISTGSTSSPNAMDIAFRLVGKIVVDDVTNARNVDASRGDVGRHQHFDLVVAKCSECLLPSRLRLVAVNCRGTDTVLLEVLRKSIRTSFRFCKDNRSVNIVVRKQFLEGRVACLPFQAT